MCGYCRARPIFHGSPYCGKQCLSAAKSAGWVTGNPVDSSRTQRHERLVSMGMERQREALWDQLEVAEMARSGATLASYASYDALRQPDRLHSTTRKQDGEVRTTSAVDMRLAAEEERQRQMQKAERRTSLVASPVDVRLSAEVLGQLMRMDLTVLSPEALLTTATPEERAQQERHREARRSEDLRLAQSNLMRLTPETARTKIGMLDAVAVIGHAELRGTLVHVADDDRGDGKVKVTVDFLGDLMEDSDESRSRTEAAQAKWPGKSFGRWAQGGANGRKVVVRCDELAVVLETGRSLRKTGLKAITTRTVLRQAAIDGDVDAATWQLEILQVTADELDEREETALMNAAECGHVAVVKLLLKHGANVFHSSNAGHTALSLVVKSTALTPAEQSNLAMELVREALRKADLAEQGDAEYWLIRLSALANTKYPFSTFRPGQPIMQVAIWLAMFGLDFEMEMEYRYTPFVLACEQQRVDVVKLLLKLGCNTDAQNYLGYTGWDCAELCRANPQDCTEVEAVLNATADQGHGVDEATWMALHKEQHRRREYRNHKTKYTRTKHGTEKGCRIFAFA